MLWNCRSWSRRASLPYTELEFRMMVGTVPQFRSGRDTSELTMRTLGCHDLPLPARTSRRDRVEPCHERFCSTPVDARPPHQSQN